MVSVLIEAGRHIHCIIEHAMLRSMGDIDGPTVAVRVYKELFAGDAEHLDPDSIPYALDAAVQGLRLKGLHPSRWGTYVHLGL